MRKPTMSSHEDIKAFVAGESDGNSESYKPVSQSNTNGIEAYKPRNQYSNGQSQPTVDANSPQYTRPSSSYIPGPQPINDAVKSAFNTTDNAMPPELIQLITQNVIQQMQAYQNIQTHSAPPVQPPQPPQTSDNTESFPSYQGSPFIDRATVYTPPSPNRPGEDLSDSESRFTMPNHPSLNSHGYQTARRGNLSPLSRNSNEEAIMSDSDTNAARPNNLRRSSTDPDATVLERHWGKLFEEDGRSTERLKCFLKGIANHLIEEIEPRYSLVITPEKMQKFYETTRLDEHPEVYPWKLVFDDKTSSISRLLRDPDVQVQHHLVQASPAARPDIPGLTPDGFATWMTLLIRAHPDHEFERLTKILRAMAINHPDDKKQRFPAAISRRLLPASGDSAISARLSDLMVTHCKIKIDSRHNSTTEPLSNEAPVSPRKPEGPPPPTVEDVPDEGDNSIHASTSIEPSQTSPRGRGNGFQPTDTSKAPSVTSIEDDGDDIPTPQARPLERERKPYVAQPGGGKSHDLASGDENDSKDIPSSYYDLRRTKSVSASQRQGPPPSIAIHQRAQVNDSADNAPTRSTAESNDSSSFRSRRYSQTPAQPHPFRRSRSNSTNITDTGGKRYHASKRSPSMTKTGFDFQNPRATVAEVNYGGSYPTSAPPYPPPQNNNYQQQPNDRYTYASRHDPRSDPRYSSSQRDPSRGRDRDNVPRTARPRLTSNAGERQYYEDSYRQSQPTYPSIPNPEYTNAYQYPPSAYQDRK